MQRKANTFFALHTALFTPRTSHLHFTLHTSSHLKSCELFSPHLAPSLLTCHLSKFFSTVFISSEHWSTVLISPKFFSTYLSSSARQKDLTVREKSLAQKTIGRRKLLHTEAWDTGAFTQKSLSNIVCTTQLAQSTSQYYFVHCTSQYYFALQSLQKALPCTTLYYEACTKHVPVLLCTTKLAQITSQYSLCATTLAQSTSRYYFVLQSLHKARPSTSLCYQACAKYIPCTTLYYKACTKHIPLPLILCTTKLTQSTSQYYFVLHHQKTNHTPKQTDRTRRAHEVYLASPAEATLHGKNKVLCAGFLPSTSPMQHSRSHYNSFCSN